MRSFPSFEATHSIVFAIRGIVGDIIAQAARLAHREPPKDLWHALIFYTTGRLTERAAARNGHAYTMFALMNGIFTGEWARY